MRLPQISSLSLAAAMLGLIAGCSPAPQSEAPPPHTMTVSGEGFVMAKPDMATLTVGVFTQGQTAGEALAANTQRMNSLFERIKTLGIADKDVQTTNFSVIPRYVLPDPTKPEAQGQINGYDASNDVTIQIRDLTKLGESLDAFVSAAGANNLRNVSFDFADINPIMDEARKKAIADAKRKAALYAEGAGVKLGEVTNIAEGGGYVPMPKYAMARNEMSAAPVPMAPGESRITANVSITYELN